MGIKVILSDMDGTIVDTESLYGQVGASYLNKYNISISQNEKDQSRGASGEGIYQLFSARSPAFKSDFPDYESFAKHRIATYYNLLQTRPDLVFPISPVMDAFTARKSTNEPAIIVTNSSMTTVEHTMKAAGVKDQFWKCAVTADYVRAQGYDLKPSGDPYRVGLDKVNQIYSANYQPHECLILEDSVVGVRAAMDFGAHVLHVLSCPSQTLSKAEVDAIRGAHGHQPDFPSYTVSDENNYQRAHDYVMQRSKKPNGLKPFMKF